MPKDTLRSRGEAKKKKDANTRVRTSLHSINGEVWDHRGAGMSKFYESLGILNEVIARGAVLLRPNGADSRQHATTTKTTPMFVTAVPWTVSVPSACYFVQLHIYTVCLSTGYLCSEVSKKKTAVFHSWVCIHSKKKRRKRELLAVSGGKEFPTI